MVSYQGQTSRWLRGPLKGGRGRKTLWWRFLVLFFFIWLAGFAIFAARLLSPPQWDGEKIVDVAIVLTGGAGRLEVAADVLRSNKARQILISGVHSDVSAAQLQRMMNLPERLVDCCMVIDKRARDTFGNADQAISWAMDVNARSLLLITSDYHLPRAYYLFSQKIRELDADITDVQTIGVSLDRSIPHIFTEYNKYLLSLIWHFDVRTGDDG